MGVVVFHLRTRRPPDHWRPNPTQLDRAATRREDFRHAGRNVDSPMQVALTRYNLAVLKFLRLSTILFLLSAAALAQGPAAAGQTVLVAPFENQSKAPGIEWISDSFPELLQERLNSTTLLILPR